MNKTIEFNNSDNFSLNIKDYDISAVPSDFNMLTLFNFIKSGNIKIPKFQRNYVWDIRKASRLIESILLGLPIPQVFLFDKGDNSLLVVDGQQRLMTIYFFMIGKFPKRDSRGILRETAIEQGFFNEAQLNDKKLFSEFRLKFDSESEANQFEGINVFELGRLEKSFNLKTIRSIVVKQIRPTGDEDSSIFELFNRLNTGGVNLLPQEIRLSLYNSKFLEMIIDFNKSDSWRKIVGREPDQRMRDVELILRMFAMLESGDHYLPTMAKFLNSYCKAAQNFSDDKICANKRLITAFVDALSQVPSKMLEMSPNKVSVMLLESLFYAWGKSAYISLKSANNVLSNGAIVQKIKFSESFKKNTSGKTTDKEFVLGRLKAARTVFIS